MVTYVIDGYKVESVYGTMPNGGDGGGWGVGYLVFGM